MQVSDEFVIVGAGILGISIAHFLSRAGRRVTVIDAASPAAGATGASDGAVSVASKKPGVMMALAAAGVAFYRRLVAGGVLGDEFSERPTFLVAGSDAEAAMLESHAAHLSATGLTVRPVPLADLPMLARGTRAVLAVEGDGHAIGYRVVHRLARGGRFRVMRHTTVSGLCRSACGAVTGVQTAAGRIDAGTVIIAAGTGTARLLGLGGILRPRKGQLVVTERAGAGGGAVYPGPFMSCRYLLSKGSHGTAAPPAPGSRTFGLVIDPLHTGQLLIGGTREETDAVGETDLEAVRRILADAVAMCPEVAASRVLRVFAGVRVATADGLPLVGPVPGADGLWLVTGFEGDGICLGPLIGNAVADMLLDRKPEVDISALSPSRLPTMELAA